MGVTFFYAALLRCLTDILYPFFLKVMIAQLRPISLKMNERPIVSTGELKDYTQLLALVPPACSTMRPSNVTFVRMVNPNGILLFDSTLNDNASSFPRRSQNREFAYVSRSGESDATLEKHAPAGSGTPHSVAEVSERLKSCLQLYDEDGIEAPAAQSEHSMFCDTWSEASEFSANNANDVFILPAGVSPSFRSLGRADSGCVPSPRIIPTKAQHSPVNSSVCLSENQALCFVFGESLFGMPLATRR